MNGRRRTEGLPGVSAGAVKMHAVALRTGGRVKKPTHVHAVHGNKAVDRKTRFVEEVLRTAEVTVAFFTHRADEIDVAHGFNLFFLQSAQHLQIHRKPTGVVTDAGRMENAVFIANFHVGTGREHRVLVCRQHEMRPFALQRPRTHGNDVAFAVHRDVGEAQFLKAAHQVFAAGLFVEGRRFDFGDGNLVGNGLRFVALQILEALHDTRIRSELIRNRRYLRLDGGQVFQIKHAGFSTSIKKQNVQILLHSFAYLLCRTQKRRQPL